MNGYANVLLTTLLSWVQGMAQSIWQLFAGQQGGLLPWVAENWLLLTILLCGIGLAVDVVIHLFRWKPHLVWASFFRRISRRSAGSKKPAHVRRWVYADGRARTERVHGREAPEQQPMLVPLPVSQGSDVPVTADEAEDEEAPEMEEVALPAVRQRRSERRNVSKAGKKLAQLLAPPEDEDELPRYKPGQLPVDREQAYHKPYIPPQWKRPGEQNDQPG